jgi:uncharacterized protein YjbI with pentapeptide repeats
MLKADCANCFGLCCVVPAFSVSSEFAIHKPAGQPCPNLQTDFRCGIHTALRPRGFAGCTVYDCFGAGQQVSQVTFGGHDWRQAPQTTSEMFDVFPIMRALHELLYYLSDALARNVAEPLNGELADARHATEQFTRAGPGDLLELDVETHRQAINLLLLRTSELVRAEPPGGALDHRGADLIGSDLRELDLRRASFRGALLVGADLRGTDLRLADLIGADLRGADLRGTDLRDAIYLTQAQLNAARGDASTRLSTQFEHPVHW